MKGRSWLQLTLVALLVLAGTLVTAPSAYAATCWGSSCTGRDPAQTYCNSDGGTPTWYQAPNGDKVEWRYSYACRAAWSRGTGFGSYPTRVWMTTGGGSGDYTGREYLVPAISGTVKTNSNGGIWSIYSNMAAGTVSACATFASGKTYCTMRVDTINFAG